MVMSDNNEEEKATARATLEQLGIEFTPEVKRNEEDEWSNWSSAIDAKVTRQQTAVHGLTLGLIVTLGFSVLLGRVVLKLVQSQKSIIEHLNSNTTAASNSEQMGSQSHVAYSKPSVRVDTSTAVVDEDLKKDLEEKIATSSQAEIPDDLT